MSRPIITLTTDFGQTAAVGTMKGVILSICPQATLVDITHEIRPQAVRQAAHVLHSAIPYFPPGVVHLVVVDPGVGSARRPVAVCTERAIYVAPDNGVLGPALGDDPAHLVIHLTETRYHLPQVSATFHGRDLFSPAAAHLASGIDPRKMGDQIPVSDLVNLPALQPELQPDGSWRGAILHVDRFGNLVSNFRFPASDAQNLALDRRFRVELGGEQIVGLSRTFADVEPAQFVAYLGSDGYLEIAVREGSAALRLGVDIGDPVWVRGMVPGEVGGTDLSGAG
jgi:S-adenosylmethionine hydrolase